MSAAFDFRKLLFATPLLAALTAVAAVAPSNDVEAATQAAVPVVAAGEVVGGGAVGVDEVVSAEDVSLAEDAAAALASNCTYFNNASHTMVVGRFGYDCCNNPVSWGRKTQYKVCGGCFPCIPPPR